MIVLTESDNGTEKTYTGTVTATNTYQYGREDASQYKLTVTKVWDDFGNQYGTRPNQSEVTLTLYRKTKSTAEQAVAINTGTSGWTATATDANKWTYTFVGGTDSANNQETFPVYAPNGEKYTYYVKENVPNAYNTAYTFSCTQTQDAPVAIKVTNKLKTVPYYVKEVWQQGENKLTFTEISNMVDLGLLTELSFQLQEKDASGSWGDSKTPNNGSTLLTVTFDGETIKKYAQTGENYPICTALPQYRIVDGEGTDKVAEVIDYRAVQTSINGKAVTPESTDPVVGKTDDYSVHCN